MARPPSYHLKDGTKVPGVTTIIGRYKESGGLIHWAWKCGVDGIDYRQKTEGSATAGTYAHELIDAFIHKRDPILVCNDPEIRALAEKGFGAFKDWAEQTRLEILGTETPLVSEEYRFGGTPDAWGRVSKNLALLDWKSSNLIYSDYLVQVAAYRELYEENHPGERIEWIHLVRVDKEFGSFTHMAWPREIADIAWRKFRLLRQAYELEGPLKRAVGA